MTGDIMAVAYQCQKVGQQPAGMELFDISVPEKPRSISFFDTSGPHSRGVHQLWFCDGEFVHMASGAPDFEATRKSAPLKWPIFARAMETLTELRGPDLLRVKGFLNVEGCKGPVQAQFVQHLAHPPVELESWPDGNRESRLVFITRNLAEEKIRALLAAVEGLA